MQNIQGKLVLDAGPGRASRAGTLGPRQIAAVSVGNALGFYDFVTYAFFAVQIGRTFFPSHTPGASLLASLATFGAGFLTRPLGAFVIGRMGDRRGRKPAMLLSFGLLGVAVTGLALTPSYASIGPVAPVLAVLFRMLQGFALGGEVGPSTAFLIEASPPLRRGLYTSFQPMGADLAVLVAGLVGVMLSSLMDGAALDAWGWRIALLIGSAIIPFGLMLRRSLDETLHETEAPEAIRIAPVRTPGLTRIILAGVAMLAGGTISNYVLDYLTTYAATTLAMPTRLAFGVTVVVGLFGVACDPLGGWLSDRFGRKPLLVVPSCVLLVSVFPCFWLIDHFRSPLALYGAAALLSAGTSLATVSAIVIITEGLPKAVRSGGLGMIYASAITVFGGSTQFVVDWLIAATGNPQVPGWYMTGGVLVGLVAILQLRETAPIRTGGG